MKTRLGYSRVDEWKPWLTTLLGQDLDALTVHLRTRKEMSKGPAHHELIADIVKLRDRVAPRTKLIINGDITDRAHGEEIAREHPGVDGLMIGRGVFANPFCFEAKPRQHSQKELIDLLRYHLDLFDDYASRTREQSTRLLRPQPQFKELELGPRNDGVEVKYEPLKKFFKIYINNFPGAAELRKQLMETKSTNEARRIIQQVRPK